MRKLLGLMTACLVIVGATALGTYLHYQAYLEEPVLAEGQTQVVIIPPGTAWPGVLEILTDARLLTRPLYFDYWGRSTGLASQVRAGSFMLEGPIGLPELAAHLRRGGLLDEVAVTIPEGFSIFHIADRLDAAGLADRAEFLRAARDTEALTAHEIDAESFEGYLFPDTYRFHKGITAPQIVARMHRRWQEIWDELLAENQHGFDDLKARYDFGLHEVVTLASIIERETGAAGERDLIARVFLNRLDRKMQLQTDPTCAYGEETYNLVPTPAMCRDPLNRYSTYVIKGLPPGPIANPGRQSLEAVLAPSVEAEALEYLFFVARRDGTHRHYFSKTYSEHKRAIDRFLRKKR